MIVGTPYGGLDEIGRSAYVNHPPYSLVCYCNARDSLTLSIQTTNLIQPNVLNGYAPILLNQLWSSVNGEVTYALPKPKWIATGAWNLPVRGVAVVYGAIVMHFMDIPGGVDFTPANGSFLEVDLNTII